MTRGTCGAKNRQGGPCSLPAGWGTGNDQGRCRKHGGNTPNGQKSAHRQAAALAVATYGIGDAGIDDPVEALLQELRRSTAAVAFIEDQITALDPDQLIRGTRSVRRTVQAGAGEGGGDAVTTVTEAGTLISPWLELLHRERTQLTRVSAVILQHGLDELALQIEKQAVTDLVSVIRGILDDLQLSSEQQSLVPDVVPRRLRALQGGRAGA